MTSIRRLSDDDRAEALGEFVGLHVHVEVRSHNADADTHDGTVVAVATRGSIGSPPSTQLILQEDHPERWRYPIIAISSATIHTIEET